MPDRYDQHPGSDALEAALADLATVVRFPPAPELAAAVVADLQGRPRPSRGTRWPSFRRSVVFAVAIALLMAGIAGAIGFGTGAIRIRFADGTPLPTPAGPTANRGWGQELSLAAAQEAVPFDIRRPSATPGSPITAFLAAVPSGGTVTLVWGDLVVTQFRADIGPDTFEKMILEGTRVEQVIVNGEPGWWIEGGTHAFFYRDADGDIVDTTLRLVGSALIWEEDGTALRVEGAASLDDALRVAASLE